MNLAMPAGLAIDFRQTPFTVVWEVTRACQLRCVHCRADTQSARLPQSLHDHNGLRGKCGRGEYRHVCGGSRARAYAVTGDPLSEDRLCSYQPLVRSIRERPLAVNAQLA